MWREIGQDERKHGQEDTEAAWHMMEGTSECPLSCIKPPQWPFGHVVVGVACGGEGRKTRVAGLPSSLTKNAARVWTNGRREWGKRHKQGGATQTNQREGTGKGNKERRGRREQKRDALTKMSKTHFLGTVEPFWTLSLYEMWGEGDWEWFVSGRWVVCHATPPLHAASSAQAKRGEEAGGEGGRREAGSSTCCGKRGKEPHMGLRSTRRAFE
jgi:hypothetical protein